MLMANPPDNHGPQLKPKPSHFRRSAGQQRPTTRGRNARPQTVDRVLDVPFLPLAIVQHSSQLRPAVRPPRLTPVQVPTPPSQPPAATST